MTHSNVRRCLFILPVLVFPFLATGRQADDKAPEKVGALTEMDVVRKVNAATDRALDYLDGKQTKTGPNAGAWRADNNGMNALAVLAFLSRGHIPGRGKYGDTVEGGVVRPGTLSLAKKFILSKSAAYDPKQPGLAKERWPLDLSSTKGNNQMYEHGLATLALSELYGMDPDPELESSLRRAVDFIVRAQNPAQGGWRYSPNYPSSDVSASVMQIVALRAASNAEIRVPDETIKKAIGYIRKMGNPSGGGYGYESAGPGSMQTSAAGALSLQLLGEVKDPQIEKTLDYIAATAKPEWKTGSVSYFYYFHYYAMQSFYQHGGKQWNEWHGPVREMLLANQNKDGSWDVPAGNAEAGLDAAGKTYSTALATLVLNIYQHYLPAYQR